MILVWSLLSIPLTFSALHLHRVLVGQKENMLLSGGKALIQKFSPLKIIFMVMSIIKVVPF